MLKKIKYFLFEKDIIAYKLRKYLRKLYEGYPAYFYFEYERVLDLQNSISVLVEDKIIKHEAIRSDGAKGYRLTAEGLKLVENWNIERLTFVVILLTLIGILFTINGNLINN